MATLTKCVCVWHDQSFSGPREWVVSIDEIDLATESTDTTSTLSGWESEAMARDEAKRQGRRLGLSVYLLVNAADDGYGRGNRHELIQGA